MKSLDDLDAVSLDETSLEDALKETLERFDVRSPKVDSSRRAATFWLPEDYKEKYDVLQKIKSTKKFHDVLREMILIVIDKTYKRLPEQQK